MLPTRHLMMAGPSYRQQIKDKLAERCRRKPGYSLRAFARDLNYGAPQLSRVINGKQHLSVATAHMLADRLFDSEVERETFVAKAEYEATPRAAVKAAALSKLERLSAAQPSEKDLLLRQDAFHVISDWYHLAILDLMTLHLAPTTTKSVARYLGISQIEAKLAIERLIRLGMLAEKKPAGWTKVHGRVVVPSGMPSSGIRKFHKAMIEKALASIEEQSIEERYLSGRTFSIAPKDMPQVRAAIDDFFTRIDEIARASLPSIRLYQINVQAFDLASPNERNKRS